MKKGNSVDNICLQVLSEASASVTHEIKNTLAIINENAGFLNDLNTMSKEVNNCMAPIQIQQATEAIIKQVSRANAIMNNLNRFAHSLDTLVKQTNLHDSLTLVIKLTERQAAMKHIAVSITCPSDCEINTCLFPLESMIYLILNRFFDYVSEHDNLTIRVIENSFNIKIIFTSKNCRKLPEKNLINRETSALVAQLKGRLTCHKNYLELSLPINFESV